VTSDKDRVERDWLLERLAVPNPTPAVSGGRAYADRDSAPSLDKGRTFIVHDPLDADGLASLLRWNSQAKAVTVMSIAQQIEPMTVIEPDRRSHSSLSLSEDKQIAEVVARLRRRFSPEQISSAELERRVRGFHRQFATARVRTFVAILVEHGARGSIEDPAGASEAAAGMR
jgi:hypothetical protein